MIKKQNKRCIKQIVDKSSLNLPSLPISPGVNWVHSICKWDFLSGVVSALLEQNIVVNTSQQERGEEDDKGKLPTYKKIQLSNWQKSRKPAAKQTIKCSAF